MAREDVCESAWGGVERTYRPRPPARRLVSWRELARHMYFHSRETPGLRVDFTRRLSEEDRARFESSLHCEYELRAGERRFTGELEGRRVDLDGGGFWCFDYLGAMLENFQKAAGAVDQPPDPAFFPVELTLRYASDLPELKGQLAGRVVVEWASEP